MRNENIITPTGGHFFSNNFPILIIDERFVTIDKLGTILAVTNSQAHSIDCIGILILIS